MKPVRLCTLVGFPAGDEEGPFYSSVDYQNLLNNLQRYAQALQNQIRDSVVR